MAKKPYRSELYPWIGKRGSAEGSSACGDNGMSLWLRKPDGGLAAGAVGPHQLPSLHITIPTWPLEGGEFMVRR